MNYIKHKVEFSKLNLVWQSEKDPNRLRYKIAELVREGTEVRLTYLKSTEDFKNALGFGFNGYPAFTIEENVHQNGVLCAFERRLPPSEREDFGRYLELFCLPKEEKDISSFSLLGYSGAKLPGDEFSIIPSFEGIVHPFEFLMEVAGFRHNFNSSEIIELNSEVNFEIDSLNKVDPCAIKILHKNTKIGYVPRTLLPELHIWLNENRVKRAVIERRNGQPDRPTLYIYVEVEAKKQ